MSFFFRHVYAIFLHLPFLFVITYRLHLWRHTWAVPHHLDGEHYQMLLDVRNWSFHGIVYTEPSLCWLPNQFHPTQLEALTELFCKQFNISVTGGRWINYPVISLTIKWQTRCWETWARFQAKPLRLIATTVSMALGPPIFQNGWVPWINCKSILERTVSVKWLYT